MKRRVALLLSATTALIGVLGAVALAQGGPVAAGGTTFSPDAVALTAGQTITINNASGVSHNLMLAGSTLEGSGTSWSYTSGPLAAGTYIYYCTLHQGTSSGGGMHVTVTVSPASTPGTPGPSPGTPAPGTPAPGTPSPGTPVDQVAPKITRVTTSRTLTRAIVRFRLDEAATVTARLRKRGSRRTLKRVTRELQAGNGHVTLRRNLTAGGRYQVALRIADDAGNVTTRTVSFTAPRS